MARARKIPLEVFAVVELFVVISLIYAPLPWLTGMGEYSPLGLMTSTVFGIALAVVALLNLVGAIGFGIHRLCAGLVALGCAVIAAFGADGGTAPMYFFGGYALALGICAIFTENAQGQHARLVRKGEATNVVSLTRPVDQIPESREIDTDRAA